MQEEDIKFLPTQYHDFAQALLTNNTIDIQKEILNISAPISKMIAASLVQESLTLQTIQNVQESASYHGYKKAVVLWLDLEIEKSSGVDKARLQNKLEILR